jgi:hypothetical protein
LEFLHRYVYVALIGMLHGKAIAGEGVGRVLRKDFSERCDLVHWLDYFVPELWKQTLRRGLL